MLDICEWIWYNFIAMCSITYSTPMFIYFGQLYWKGTMDLNVKKFLRHMNRGVLLGGIIVVGLVIYIAVDTVNFKKDIPMFEQFIEDYYANISEIAVTPEENQSVKDLDITKKELARVREEYSSFIDENWTNYSNDLYYYTTKEDVIRNVNNFNGIETKNLEGYVTNWSYKLSEIKVNKLGPNIISITYVDDVTAEFTGNPLVMNVDGLTLPNFMGFSRNYEELKGKEKMEKATLSNQRTIKLKKVDGKWKIYGSENFYGGDNFEVVGGDENVNDIKG